MPTDLLIAHLQDLIEAAVANPAFNLIAELADLATAASDQPGALAPASVEA